MKWDVGMSLHKKKRDKKMPTPRQKVIHNPIPTSLLKILIHFMVIGICTSVCIALFVVFSLHIKINSFKKNKDVGMGL